MDARVDEVHHEQLERVMQAAYARLDPRQAEELRTMGEASFRYIPDEDLEPERADKVYGLLLSLWKFGERRRPGTSALRVFNPRVEAVGWVSGHTVVEIVNDDMPFLVDSVAAALGRRGLRVHSLVHPILFVERDGNGERLGLRADGQPRAGGAVIAESMMHIEIDEQTAQAVLDEIEAELQTVLSDVRAAVDDWPAMLAQVDSCLAELAEAPAPVSDADRSEAQALLQWMRDNHFTFLGYREYDYREEGEALAMMAESGLGLLRDPSRRVMRQAGSDQSAADMAPEVRQFLREPRPMLILKANVRSTVHRPVHLDYIAVKRFDPDGHAVGERRFIGLFTSAAYNRLPGEIPYLRGKVARILERADLPPRSHDAKALHNILDTFPRDELFQIDEDTLFRFALAILALQDRPRLRLFVRYDPFQRFASCMIFVPRDVWSSELRRRFEAILCAAFDGHVANFYTQIGDDPLARTLAIISTNPGAVPEVDLAKLEQELVRATRSWTDLLRDELTDRYGEDRGLKLWREFRDGIPRGYQEFVDPAHATFDVATMREVKGDRRLSLNLYRPIELPDTQCRFKLFNRDTAVVLSDVLPMIERMGLRVLEERQFRIARDLGDGTRTYMIHDFLLQVDGQGVIDIGAVKQDFEEAFAAVWCGEAESDGFNRLVLAAGLNWREVVILRAICKYLRQTGIAFSQDYMEEALASNPVVASDLVKLFHIRFDPQAARDREEREAQAEAVARSLAEALDAVQSLDEDRILRRFLNVVEAGLRTNFYQPAADGPHKPYLSFKVNSQLVEEMPPPVPYREIFVYAPEVEGIHLRGGPVARGGLRWSDRREDFRTEVLGLMKAQMVKNAVIVPVGSKGGFVPKRPPVGGDRDAVIANGIACYKTFIRGLLDVTDNLDGADLLPPAEVVRHDGDDPYLVVAADKGTATFSDIANGIAEERGFWLGDAFASGGAAGYDHKKMAITARGAWELVKRHFRELGKNIQEEDFTVVGVGDMSGDVFGNGMLLSRHIRLLAAFDHRNIFVDPAPDPATSWVERKRLFDLPRSSWMDYDQGLLSPGGRIYDRRAKSVTLTPEIKAWLGAVRDAMTPTELIRTILKAQAELLWIGGIGTYVKASHETDAQVGDKANDALRVNGADLRVQVVGEGGNLGFTQAGRIEFALNGGRLNTDAVDNSAGVDCSDHEVNIKILLNAAVTGGDLTRKQRDQIMVEMTDEVAQLVLQNNYLQGEAISLTEAHGPAALDSHMRFVRELERAGLLNPRLEGLPDDEMLAEREAMGKGLCRPEIAVLLAYAKTTLYSELLASNLPDEPYFEADLVRYFPKLLQDRFLPEMRAHKLRREIIATVTANSVVNHAGVTFVSAVKEETGASAPDIARAFAVVREVFDLHSLWAAIDALDNQVPAQCQIRMNLAARELVRNAALWFMQNRPAPISVADTVAEFGPGIRKLGECAHEYLMGEARQAFEQRRDGFVADGAPQALAERVSVLQELAAAPTIVAAANRHAHQVGDVGRFYFAFGAMIGLDWLRDTALAAGTDDYWDRIALHGLVDDMSDQQSRLAAAALAECGPDVLGDDGEAIRNWAARRGQGFARLERLMAEYRAGGGVDLARVAIVNRALDELLVGGGAG